MRTIKVKKNAFDLKKFKKKYKLKQRRRERNLAVKPAKQALKKFQEAGIRFMEATRIRCILADEMGLGKTAQYIHVIKRNRKKCIPAIIVCKAALKYQVYEECVRHLGTKKFKIQVIESNKEDINRDTEILIISYNSLRPYLKVDESKVPNEGEGLGIPYWKKSRMIKRFKLIIVDEFHLINNLKSKRTRQVKQIAKFAKCIIGVSGTPVKNATSEYYVMLDMIKPGFFGTEAYFKQLYLNRVQTSTGRIFYTGIRPDRKQAWEQTMSGILIRRTREEVAPELPPVERRYKDVIVNNATFWKDYYALVDLIRTEVKLRQTHVAKLRLQVGRAKLNAAIDFIVEWSKNKNKKSDKLVVFYHHITVGKNLVALANALCEDSGSNALHLDAKLNVQKRNELLLDFKNKKRNDILIASTLASGDGYNLQFCNQALIVERQWNPS